MAMSEDVTGSILDDWIWHGPSYITSNLVIQFLAFLLCTCEYPLSVILHCALPFVLAECSVALVLCALYLVCRPVALLARLAAIARFSATRTLTASLYVHPLSTPLAFPYRVILLLCCHLNLSVHALEHLCHSLSRAVQDFEHA